MDCSIECSFAASEGLTPEQREIQNVANAFAANEMRPFAAKWDEEVREKKKMR